MMGEPPVARGNFVCLMMYSLQLNSVCLVSGKTHLVKFQCRLRNSRFCSTNRM